ncbi:hypothetical protein OF122_13150 [Pelagibacterium flavum]|uniref:Uncharacterized protein n=1 Tax=Pelagibacterium flavum TaxID=2984530 RepID=A0ABY6IKK0_9HYPH|nr:hypothetical protein [Pelagibacterium sp. YIM 151497]UYQ71006.1 hypothetical protein OF122_13150 [Pelagibacterium sp. YIM 151497]
MSGAVKHARWFALHSTTGVNIGLWQEGAIAVKVQAEYPGSTITEMVEVTPAVDAVDEMLEALKAAIANSDANIGPYGRTPEAQAVYDQVSDAIAKATGSKP